VVVTG